MANDRIELTNGFVAYLGEGEVYSCKVPWLGREIKVGIYSTDEDSETSVESIKKAFENFWADKNSILKVAQNDIVEKYIPYVAEHKNPDAMFPYLKISEDDFYADYWLTEIYMVTGEYGSEMQITFESEDGENSISVHRDLDSGSIIEFFDGLNEIYSEDMD